MEVETILRMVHAVGKPAAWEGQPPPRTGGAQRRAKRARRPGGVCCRCQALAVAETAAAETAETAETAMEMDASGSPSAHALAIGGARCLRLRRSVLVDASTLRAEKV